MRGLGVPNIFVLTWCIALQLRAFLLFAFRWSKLYFLLKGVGPVLLFALTLRWSICRSAFQNVHTPCQMPDLISGVGCAVFCRGLCLDTSLVVFLASYAHPTPPMWYMLGERKIRMCNWKYRPGGGRIYEGETSAYPEK